VFHQPRLGVLQRGRASADPKDTDALLAERQMIQLRREQVRIAVLGVLPEQRERHMAPILPKICGVHSVKYLITNPPPISDLFRKSDSHVRCPLSVDCCTTTDKLVSRSKANQAFNRLTSAVVDVQQSTDNGPGATRSDQPLLFFSAVLRASNAIYAIKTIRSS